MKVDERIIGNGEVGPITRKLQAAYKMLTEQSSLPIPHLRTVSKCNCDNCEPSAELKFDGKEDTKLFFERNLLIAFH